MTIQADEEARLLQKKVAELKKKDFLPEPLLNLVAAIYTAQIEARPDAAVAAPPQEELPGGEMRAQGAPLVERRRFAYDASQAKALFADFIEYAKEQGEPLASAVTLVGEALDKGELDLDKAFHAYIHEDQEFFDNWAKRTPEAPRTVAFLTQSALMPSLAAAADALAGEREQGPAWSHGHCPTCGSLPLIGSLREKEGQRYLTCSFCLTDYRTKRLGCPICDETEFDKLAFYTVEEEPGFRVDVCESCKRYIKVADFRELDRKLLPLLDDLASLPFDILATKKGYSRATLSGWGF